MQPTLHAQIVLVGRSPAPFVKGAGRAETKYKTPQLQIKVTVGYYRNQRC